jgi:monoamine oxidase
LTTLIIGGGLSGLALADMLQSQGKEYLLVEARDRFGGRISTKTDGAGYYDMGPAWFWPGQPRIAALIDRLGLEKFDQYADGALTYENERGQVQRERGFSSMQGSWRLKGGLGSLTDTLAAGLPALRKRLNAPVVSVAKTSDILTATFADGSTCNAAQVVIALPPRIAAEIEFTPALPDATIAAMQTVPTWMAGQAKAVAIYDSAFWRDAGLSGDAMSRHGPMVEVHDASPDKDGPYALFGFIGVPPEARHDTQNLRHHILKQLVRLFGDQAGNPRQLLIKDWAFDPYTATIADQAPLYAHPAYGSSRALTDLWGGRLILSGTEVAPQFGGYIEGALEAAENTLKTLQTL